MTLAPVVTVIEEARQAGIAPGVAAVVLVRGSAVHASVHGDAQIVPQRRHLTEDDLFDLASLTKLYLASAVARLCDRGVLDLDAPLATLDPPVQPLGILSNWMEDPPGPVFLRPGGSLILVSDGIAAGHEEPNDALPLGARVTVIAPGSQGEGPPRLLFDEEQAA